MITRTLDPGILSLSIEGRKYTFQADSAFAEQVAILAEEAERRADMASADSRQNASEVAAFLSYAIDSLLGNGTVATVFGENEPEILSLLDILDGIMETFRQYRAGRLAKLKGGRL